uniref:Uncharacterized protein AlNc14C122G6705 n=1 Tax=Albugo laibachii Nc14 TaxID=890382 RepID=F0WJI0_9STRA|nr:conserved hypothetical protein [Albugo laibachii Nc14]|eukprot:CCA21429.1 conserved hypothetical protein [Albugo laibachii Nc14]
MIRVSPIQCVRFRQQLIHVKRDDLLPLEGNKMRKLYWLLQQRKSFFDDAHIFSYGGSNSNAMLAIAQLSQLKRVPFTYFCEQERFQNLLEGNMAISKMLGMHCISLSKKDFRNLVEEEGEASIVRDHGAGKRIIFIPRGAAFQEAKFGIEQLARELNSCSRNQATNISMSVVLPSGTGTTAFYLAQYLDKAHTVHTIPCVGDHLYLRNQFQKLASDFDSTPSIPNILIPKTKKRFGQLYKPFYDVYGELLESTEIEFDLLYGCVAWLVMFENFQSLHFPLDDETKHQVIYIHTGGVSGNPTMLQRYGQSRLIDSIT